MLPLAQKESQIYKAALQLVKEVYGITACFPHGEQLVLVYKLRRAAVDLCEAVVALNTSKESKRKKKTQACVQQCITIDMHLEIAVALYLISADEIKKAEGQLESIFGMLTAAPVLV